MVPRNRQELQRSRPGTPQALFPALYRLGAYIQQQGEERLTRVQGIPNLSNLARGHALGRPGNLSNTKIKCLALLKGKRILKRFPQLFEDSYLALWHGFYLPIHNSSTYNPKLRGPVPFGPAGLKGA